MILLQMLLETEWSDMYYNLTRAFFEIVDRKSDQRLRTVVLGPITLPDLENELIKDHINRCVQYFLRMHVNEGEGTTTHDGSVFFLLL